MIGVPFVYLVGVNGDVREKVRPRLTEQERKHRDEHDVHMVSKTGNPERNSQHTRLSILTEIKYVIFL